MNIPLQKTAVLFTSLLGAAALAAEPPAERIAAVLKVMSVDEVTVRAAEGQPTHLTIEAAGMVNSGGWTQPALRARPGPAANGVLVFDFVARPPGGPATQALAPIKAAITVEKPANYAGVEVSAQANSKTAK